MNEYKVAAIDLDGTIISFSWETYVNVKDFGEVDQDMVIALRNIQKAGWHIIIHTCRMTPEIYEADGFTKETMLAFLRKFLTENNIPFDEIWDGLGKPIARIYVDDRAITPVEFKGHFG